MPERNQVYSKNCIDLHFLWMYNMIEEFNLISEDLLELFKF